MKITTEQLISQFHSLQGTTIEERRKNLFILLNNIKRDGCDDTDVSSLHPKTPLEERFKVDLLICLQKFSELMHILKSENTATIDKVLKSTWFVKLFIENISGKELVTNVFPYISFNTKLKILNKLVASTRDHKKANEYFDSVQEKYGFYLASKVLPACNLSTIEKCIDNYKFKPTDKQLLIIVEQHPEGIESVLRKLDLKNINRNYKSVLKYIARQNPRLFIKLYNEYFSNSINLGWRITQKLVESQPQDVISNSKQSYSMMHKKQILKSLDKEQFRHFYTNLFPSNLEGFYKERIFLGSVLNMVPDKKRNSSLLWEIAEQIYGKQFWKGSDYCERRCQLKKLPDELYTRQIKLEHPCLKLKEEEKPKKSVPEIIKEISETSNINDRRQLVGELVKRGRIDDHKNHESLKGIFKYIINKHRNDFKILKMFMSNVDETYDVKEFDEELWTYVHKILENLKANDVEYMRTDDFKYYYIYFRIKNNLDIKENLIEHILKEASWSLSVPSALKDYEKQYLLMVGELLSELFKVDDERQNNAFRFLRELLKWNKKHPKDEISLHNYPQFMNTVITIWNDPNSSLHSVHDITDHYIFETNKFSLEERLRVLKLCLPKAYGNKEFFKKVYKFLKKEPRTLEIFDDITKFAFKNEFKSTVKFWRYCKYFSHLGIPEKIIEMAKKVFEEHPQDSRNVLTCLSCLMSDKDFKEFILPYYPANKLADIRSEEAKVVYAAQKSIAASFKYIKSPVSALEIALAFCKGDYLKFVLRNLYYISYNVNENELLVYLSNLSERAVSVRKHSMKLTLSILDKISACNNLKTIIKTEQNVSLRKHTLESIFKYFIKNPDNFSWEILQESFHFIDMEDRELRNMVLRLDQIPQPYMETYIHFTWNFFISNLQLPQDKKRKYSLDLIQSVVSNHSSIISSEFYDRIIEYYGISSLHYFVCRYIIYCNRNPESHLLDALNKMKTQEDYKDEILKFTNMFLWQFNYNLAFTSNNLFCIQSLHKVREAYNEVVLPHESFDQYLKLEFTVIFVSSKSQLVLGEMVVKLLQSILNSYGPTVIYIFCETFIRANIDYCNKKKEEVEENVLYLVENLIKQNVSDEYWIMAIYLLSHIDPTLETRSLRYKELVKEAEKNPRPVIQLLIRNHLSEAHVSSLRKNWNDKGRFGW